MSHMIVMLGIAAIFADEETRGPATICEQELFDQCMASLVEGGEAPEPPIDWEGEPEAFCSACLQAWMFGALPMIPWFMIPVALGLSLLAGWGLTQCVEKPAQSWIRGESSLLACVYQPSY
jgi:hypothetical protein